MLLVAVQEKIKIESSKLNQYMTWSDFKYPQMAEVFLLLSSHF